MGVRGRNRSSTKAGQVNELSLFAGAGGGILGGKLLGWRTVCAVEIDPYCRRVLMQRQNDGVLDPFPIWDDVRTFDGIPWKGRIDVISGGFPCQDISAAGNGAGIDGARSGLWKEFARVIREVRPRFVFVENSPMLTARGLGVVLGDLAALGYDAEWCVLGASDVGAPHIRKRIWILAHSNGTGIRDAEQRKEGRRVDVRNSGSTESVDDGSKKSLADSDRVRKSQSKGSEQEQRRRSIDGCEELADTNGNGRLPWRSNHATEIARGRKSNRSCEQSDGMERTNDWWSVEPSMGRVVNGMAHRMDRLRSLGNGQVPAVAALAWRTLNRQRCHFACANSRSMAPLEQEEIQ